MPFLSKRRKLKVGANWKIVDDWADAIQQPQHQCISVTANWTDALADRSVSRCGCHAVSSWEDRCVCFVGLGRGGVDCGPRRQLRDYPNLKPNRTELRIQLFFPQHGRCAPIPTPKWWIGVHLGFCFLLSNAFDPGVKSSSVTQMQRKQWN